MVQYYLQQENCMLKKMYKKKEYYKKMPFFNPLNQTRHKCRWLNGSKIVLKMLLKGFANRNRIHNSF